MSTTNFEDTPAMQKIFEAAGIENETPNTENKGSADETKGPSSESGATNEDGTPKADPAKDALGTNSDGSKIDGRTKQGKEEKAAKSGGADALEAGSIKLQDGTIVKAGSERRWFDTAQTARQQLTHTKNELNTANQKFSTLQTKYTELENTVKQIGFEDPVAVTYAVKLYKDLSRDPQGTMTKLLAEMKAKGHTFEGIGGTIDTAAISHLLDTKLPNTSSEQKVTQEQIQQKASEDVAQFVSQFPDAVTHEMHIAALIDRSIEAGRPISMVDAYFALKNKVAEDGLDWSKPLGPQVEARKTPQQQTPDPKPRVNGRAPAETPLDPGNVVQPERELDSDSIVAAAMKEAGYNLNR